MAKNTGTDDDAPKPEIENLDALDLNYLLGWLHADMKASGTITPERWNAAARSAKESFARQEEARSGCHSPKPSQTA